MSCAQPGYHVLAELLETQLGAGASLVPARPLRLLEVGATWAAPEVRFD